MIQRQTYELAVGPDAMPVEAYSRTASQAYRKLLESEPEERAVQEFFEAHPAFMPGFRTPGGVSGHHPLHCALISQPNLPGLDSRRPDFMWLATHSDTWFPTLIEIEKPSKRIFRSNGVPRAEFTQAMNQLNEWRTWFQEPENQIKFRRDYGVPKHWIDHKKMRLHMILVYGRRHEFELDATLGRHRASLAKCDDEELMSFDRLAPDPRLLDALTVRADGVARYTAVAAPPTLTLGPNLADRFLVIDGLEAAIDATPGWSAERRDFVKHRLPYWREWARASERNVVRGGDRE